MSQVQDTSVILVCAGNATRMQGKNKILLPLGDTNVIGMSMRAFEACPRVAEIIVVARPSDHDAIRETAQQCGITKFHAIVAGGSTRQESVMCGLRALSKGTTMIAVHDGARPLVTDAVICRAVSKAKKFGAAAPAVRVKDTIKVSTDGAVEETPDRSKLYAVQTPQVFDRDLIAAALQNAKEQEIAITDDCSAVEALGMPVQLTDGDEENLKITTPLDLELAALILRRRAGV